MTRKLILMRHAKSSWDNPKQDDHARPLNARGRASATALGDWLRAQDHVPDEILCSSAARTRETCALLGVTAPVTNLDHLYHAAPQTLHAHWAEATGQTVLMIGHNPGIATFAAQLVTRPPDHVRFFAFPTGATLVLEVASQNWGKLQAGRTLDFVVPRDLI